MNVVFQEKAGWHSIGVTALFCLFLLAAGCAQKAWKDPRYEGSRIDLPAPGYTIQMGAFSNVENAIGLVETLESQGVYAYYFPHPSGLYKVRCGDYATREEATVEAEHLLRTGVIEEYYIVTPEHQAALRARRYGEGSLRAELVRTAERFVGVPYRWGGNSSKEGFDCSGLTMAVYQLNGLNLPRSSREQFRAGNPVQRRDLSEGDLVFFRTGGGGRVTHVGIYRGGDQFIHAPGKGKTIRTDSLTNGYYSRRYAGARSYISG
jgi:hypothetical protein